MLLFTIIVQNKGENMTKPKKKMLHSKMGQRLKQLAKEHNLTREDMSELINYSCGHISRFYNGTIKIPDNAAQILSNLWNIRKEFILCEDDFRTDEDIYLSLNENSVKDMQITIEYLKTLGLVLRPYTTLTCPLTALYRHFSQIQSYIKESEIQRLQHKYNFELPSEEFSKTYFTEECTVELSSPLPTIPFLHTEKISKISNQTCTVLLHNSDKNNLMGVNCEITLFFKVYYHNELLRTINTHDLQEFIKKLDIYSKCTIETILFDKNFGDHFSS